MLPWASESSRVEGYEGIIPYFEPNSSSHLEKRSSCSCPTDLDTFSNAVWKSICWKSEEQQYGSGRQFVFYIFNATNVLFSPM